MEERRGTRIRKDRDLFSPEQQPCKSRRNRTKDAEPDQHVGKIDGDAMMGEWQANGRWTGWLKTILFYAAVVQIQC